MATADDGPRDPVAVAREDTVARMGRQRSLRVMNHASRLTPGARFPIGAGFLPPAADADRHRTRPGDSPRRTMRPSDASEAAPPAARGLFGRYDSAHTRQRTDGALL